MGSRASRTPRFAASTTAIASRLKRAPNRWLRKPTSAAKRSSLGSGRSCDEPARRTSNDAEPGRLLPAAARDEQSHPELRRRDLLAVPDADRSGIEAVSGVALHLAFVSECVLSLPVPVAKDRGSAACRADRGSRAEHGHENAELGPRVGIAEFLPARPRAAALPRHATATGRARRRRLRNGLLEAVHAVVAPQRRSHHQPGVRTPRADTARPPTRGFSPRSLSMHSWRSSARGGARILGDGIAVRLPRIVREPHQPYELRPLQAG